MLTKALFRVVSDPVLVPPTPNWYTVSIFNNANPSINTSYFPNTKYEHPDNPIQDFRPEYAIKLLNEAGWFKKPGEKNQLLTFYIIHFKFVKF